MGVPRDVSVTHPQNTDDELARGPASAPSPIEVVRESRRRARFAGVRSGLGCCMRPAWWCMVACAGLLGCGARGPRVAAHGDEGWHELTSRHFVLETDLELDEGQRLVTDLESIYDALQQFAFPYRQPMDAVTHVAIFDGFHDLSPLGYRATGGLYLYDGTGALNDAPLMLLPAAADDDKEHVVHELCHAFIAYYYPQAPLWLNEGLAEYYSTVAIEEHEVAFGAYLPGVTFSADERGIGVSGQDAYLVIPSSAVPPFAELRKLDAARFYGDDLADPDSLAADDKRAVSYKSAWAAVHTLQDLPNGRRRFAAYLESLHAAAVDEPTAFQQSFGDVPSGALETAFRHFLVAHETSVVHIPSERSDPEAPSVRRMTPAEVLRLFADARNRGDPEATKVADSELERALTLEPTSAAGWRQRGLRLLLLGELASAEKDLRRAHELGAGAPAYAHALALLLAEQHDEAADVPQGAEFTSLMKELMQRGRTSAELNFVARYLLAKQNASSAQHFALRALKANASCYRCFETLALVAEARDDLAVAVRAQTSAVNLIPHALADRKAVARLQQYRARLQAGSGPATN